MMHEHGKSDRPIVPAKVSNEAEPEEAKETLEGEGLAKGRTLERNVSRTQSRSSMSSALERIRQAARGDKGQRFTALLHHVYAVEMFDFILGTHPISTKGTSEIGGAKRRSDFEFYTEPPWFFNPDFFSASFSL